LAKGQHPIPFEVPVKPEDVSLLNWKPKYAAKRAAKDLISFEEEIMKDSAKSFRKNKKQLIEPAEEEVEETKQAQLPETPKQQSKKKSQSPKVF